MITLHCLNCRNEIANQEHLTIYQETPYSSHLIIKPEKRNSVLNSLLLNQEPCEKKRKFTPNLLFCLCNSKLGTETCVGPRAEPLFAFKSDSIYLMKYENGVQMRHAFPNKSKWKWADQVQQLPMIEVRNQQTFYGINNSTNSTNKMIKTFKKTLFPSSTDVFSFNIASHIIDMPREYQIELYVCALLENSVIYLPTGAGKTLIAAMVSVYMKQNNPEKKIFFVTDRIPLVFQQASYLRLQTGLTVGEFCGENKQIMKSQLNNDIFVLTADFLINKLLNKEMYLEECSCLIIDEIHHASGEHSFSRLIKEFYKQLDPEYRPRLVGLTASPSSSAQTESDIRRELERLSNLIEGSVCMPNVYLNELEQMINRPEIKFNQIEDNPSQLTFMKCVGNYIEKFLQKLNSNIRFELKSLAILKGFIGNLLKELNLQMNQKSYLYASHIEKLINSMEIMSIVGIDSAVNYIREFSNKEIKNNSKNFIWKQSELAMMHEYLDEIKRFSGKSAKLEAICDLLKTNNDFKNDSRIIIFVRQRKTARFLLDYLKKDKEIDSKWHPSLFVGHANGGYDGMMWFGEQDVALNNFHEGSSRLIVSTNVLQEGLDVPICDYVIIFDRMWSLTEFVQSRGRARHVQSKYLVYASAEEKCFYESLVNTEHNLVKILKESTNNDKKINRQSWTTKFSDLNALIKTSDKKHEENRIIREKKKFVRGKNRQQKFYLIVYLNEAELEEFYSLIKSCKGYSTSEQLNSTTINKKQDLNLEYLEQSNVVKCYFELKNVANDQDDSEQSNFKNVLETIDFLLSQKRMLIHVLHSRTRILTHSNVQSMATGLTFGNLISSNEFRVTKSSDSNIFKFIIDYEMKCILILFLFSEYLYKIEVSFDSIDQFVFLDKSRNQDVKQNNKLNVFIPLRQYPLVYRQMASTEQDRINESNLKSVEQQYVDWSRIEYEHINWSIWLQFGSNEQFHVIKGLESLSGIKCLFSSIETTNIAYKLSDMRRDFLPIDFATRYWLECFISQCEHVLVGKVDYRLVAILNKLESDQLSRVLEKLTYRLANARFLNLFEILESTINEMLEKPSNLEFISDKENKIVLIRRATLTPSRLIFHFPEPNVSNRVIRKYGPDSFMRVRFRDEDMRKLNMSQSFSNMSSIYARIKRFLLNGTEIAANSYEFLAMSSSQMREHSCWMFKTSSQLNAQMVRNWMGDFESIRCIGKYAARLGQSLSCSIETFETNDFCMIPDIKKRDPQTENEYCFTDGIGKISKEKALEICKKYSDISYASSFQIRFAGFKGVVAVDPNLTERKLQFRESMKKFESGYNRLDLLNVAEYIPCYLNRQIIIILSTLGIQDSVFLNLLDKMLNNMSKMLVDENIALSYISRYFRNIFAISKSPSPINYLFESFHRELLKPIHKSLLNDLIHKSRIFIEKGRILMGCIDETGILEENQVFIHCRPGLFDQECLLENDSITLINYMNQESFVVTSKVIVAKNPCMHPGDIRVMQAVDITQLHHMIDCIVFPVTGSRPITNMCSGSDLDGDLYFVSWEASLIPEQTAEPMSYASNNPTINKETPIQIEDVISFFVNFIEMDQLGRIANAHVAISDSSKAGVNDPICITLAQLFSSAVDFPKTGVVAEFPPELKNLKYPDFMEKNGQSYVSEKIIGVMYRKCKMIASNDFEFDDIKINSSFLLKGYEAHINQAKEAYHLYRQEIQRIMLYFEYKHENELFVGPLLTAHHYSQNKANEFLKLSLLTLKKLWDHMRKLFAKQVDEWLLANKPNCVSDKREREKVKKEIASAWYFVAYSSKENTSLRILSFPWILEDIFINNFDLKNYDLFARSIIENFLQNEEDYQKSSRYLTKIELKKKISSIINKKLEIVGLFGLFMFEDESDVELFVYNSNQVDMPYFKEQLEPYFDNITLMNNDVLKSDHNEENTFTLYYDQSTLMRHLYLKKMIFENPLLLTFLYSAIHFARLDGIFSFLSAENVKIENYLDFCLEYCISSRLVHDLTTNEMNNLLIETENEASNCFDDWLNLYDELDRICNLEDFFQNTQLGKIMLNFYKENAFEVARRFVFKNKFANDSEHVSIELTEKGNLLLRNHFLKVFNNLSKTIDISQVWWSIDTFGCLSKPFIRNKFVMSKHRGKAQNLFVKNASLMVFSNMSSMFEHLEFEMYKGYRRSQHLTKQCWSPSMCKKTLGFTNECFQTVLAHSMIQFNNAKTKNNTSKYRYQMKFGDFYFTSLPFSFHEVPSIAYSKLNDAWKRTLTHSEIDYDSSQNFILKKKKNEQNYTVNSNPELKNQKIKKKQNRGYATSAFDSNINSDMKYLQSLFDGNDFDMKISECYLCFFDIEKNDHQIKFRIKYDGCLNLQRIETFPLKWLCVDLKNASKKEKNRDVRMTLYSKNKIELETFKTQLEPLIGENVEKCIIKAQSSANDDGLVVNESFREANLVVRHSKSISYSGNFESWKQIFDLTQTPMPTNISHEVYEKILVSICDTDEYSENDHNGFFTKTSKRKEFFITIKLNDLTSLQMNQYKDMISLYWHIALLFSKILE